MRPLSVVAAILLVACGSEPSSRTKTGTFNSVPRHTEEYRGINGEPVLVFSHFSGRGKTSGMTLGQMRAD
jgi:hypothetical protein